MFREDSKKIKITQLVESTLTKNMQNLPIKSMWKKIRKLRNLKGD